MQLQLAQVNLNVNSMRAIVWLYIQNLLKYANSFCNVLKVL